MLKLLLRALVVIAILWLPLNSFGAEAVKLRYKMSIYADGKGGGLKQPEGVACNDQSLLLVADTGNGRLLTYTLQVDTVTAGPEIKILQLSNPVLVQVNSKGEIYSLDRLQRRIVRLTPRGEFKGYLEPKGLPSPGSYIPRSLAIDSNDNIYILDVFSGRVLVVSGEGEYKKSINFPDDYGFFSDLFIDSQDNLFLLDEIKATLFSAPKGSTQFSPLTKNLREHVSFPSNLATDGEGRIYILDRHDGGIIVAGRDGSFQGRLLGKGWREGLLRYPSQLCINKRGEGFIADTGNNRIQIFSLVK